MQKFQSSPARWSREQKKKHVYAVRSFALCLLFVFCLMLNALRKTKEKSQNLVTLSLRFFRLKAEIGISLSKCPLILATVLILPP